MKLKLWTGKNYYVCTDSGQESIKTVRIMNQLGFEMLIILLEALQSEGRVNEHKQELLPFLFIKIIKNNNL
jgi:hypothetical protein